MFPKDSSRQSPFLLAYYFFFDTDIVKNASQFSIILISFFGKKRTRIRLMEKNGFVIPF